MAASVPVIATDTGGVQEVVVDGVTGRLLRPANPVAAADAIVALAGDAATRSRFAVEALYRLGDEFDSRRMVTQLEEIYEEILGRSVRQPAAATSASHLGARSSKH
jgi:glycosyltransferase involved in cell wall biosynthesis